MGAWDSCKCAPNLTGLDKLRYVAEQTFALLHQFERLTVRWKHRLEFNNAFVSLGCSPHLLSTTQEGHAMIVL